MPGPPIPQPHGGALTNWLPGESGNPAGRKSCGATVKEWLNVFALRAVTQAELRKISKSAPTPAERIAATRLLRAVPDRQEAEFCCEQTDGRPNVHVTTESLPPADPKAAILAIRELLGIATPPAACAVPAGEAIERADDSKVDPEPSTP